MTYFGVCSNCGKKKICNINNQCEECIVSIRQTISDMIRYKATGKGM